MAPRAHRLCDATGLAGARAPGARLGHRGGERPVDASVAPDDARGEAAEPGLGHAGREVAQAGLGRAEPAAVVRRARLGAEQLGLGVDDAVGDLLGHRAHEPLHVHEAVPGPRRRRGGGDTL